jgi:predicted nucleotidyltransferase
VRCRRPAPRQFELAENEGEYLREHWAVLSDIAEVLRTERNVRLAVVFGSFARGTSHSNSDVDIMVSLAEERPLYLAHLQARLQQALGREVDVLPLKSLRAREPSMLASIVRDGRPLIDRDGLWAELQGQRPAIERAGRKARSARRRRAADAIAQLVGE